MGFIVCREKTPSSVSPHPIGNGRSFYWAVTEPMTAQCREIQQWNTRGCGAEQRLQCVRLKMCVCAWEHLCICPDLSYCVCVRACVCVCVCACERRGRHQGCVCVCTGLIFPTKSEEDKPKALIVVTFLSPPPSSPSALRALRSFFPHPPSAPPPSSWCSTSPVRIHTVQR